MFIGKELVYLEDIIEVCEEYIAYPITSEKEERRTEYYRKLLEESLEDYNKIKNGCRETLYKIRVEVVKKKAEEISIFLLDKHEKELIRLKEENKPNITSTIMGIILICVGYALRYIS